MERENGQAWGEIVAEIGAEIVAEIGVKTWRVWCVNHGRLNNALMQVTCIYSFRPPPVKNGYAWGLIYRLANPPQACPLGLRSNPHKEARHKPANHGLQA